ncbi:GDSL Lipase/Acylhydrolase [Exidia glandulosa HHB12029]|uniref:GDSL Lipase/Acylhydrolase n=1 Tax=Exidia glandulosa HHB12029 TaxID=1314781 RepID=A0A165KKQ7_EXIGL|nr:GDSL Lipase/Acylhydrolase [Exidia glandulosa HHB12029]
MASFDSIVLFGDSITEGAFAAGGFGFLLADAYRRKLDVLNRGMGGYTTDWALPVFEQVIPKKDVQPKIRLVVIWFGANDAVVPGFTHHVPLERFKTNLGTMLSMLRDPSSDWYHTPEQTKILLVTPPPIEEKAVAHWLATAFEPPFSMDRKFANTKMYADAVRAVGAERGVPVIDMWSAIWDAAGQTTEGLGQFLPDGLHLNAAGYKYAYDLIVETIATNWPELKHENVKEVFTLWENIDKENPRPSLQANRLP